MYMYSQYIFNIYLIYMYILNTFILNMCVCLLYTHLRIFNQKKEQKILRNAVNNK